MLIGNLESSWASAWNEHIGPDALRVIAPHDEIAFLQPPTNKPTSQQSIEAADLLLPNVEHEVKRTWSTTRADQAIFSLVGSLSRPNVKESSQFEPDWTVRRPTECRGSEEKH
jgi:hypothetical protein